MKKFTGIYTYEGGARQVTFEAADYNEAVRIASSWSVGITGEAANTAGAPAALPEAYDQETARQLLGGISKSTLYAELATGRLERMPGTRRVLITRKSIEKRCCR